MNAEALLDRDARWRAAAWPCPACRAHSHEACFPRPRDVLVLGVHPERAAEAVLRPQETDRRVRAWRRRLREQRRGYERREAREFRARSAVEQIRAASLDGGES